MCSPFLGGTTVLPKPLRNALTFLATENQVQLLTLSLKEELSHSDPRNESDDAPSIDPDLDLDRMPDLEWSEGVEEYKKLTRDDLWAMLGRSAEKSIPFFNLKQDAESHCDPWTDEGEAWLQDPSNGDSLALRWHQLVGVLKMVENAFLKKPVLLMDGVGLGKTIQVAAFVAVLAWYREFFATHGKFPGKFGVCFLYFLEFLRLL
jgi:SNF2 family DNA or RNA helicase